jgi:hypothetical protein
MADRHSHRAKPDRNRAELDQLDFDHHREERRRLMGTPRSDDGRRAGADLANGNRDDGCRDLDVSMGRRESGRPAPLLP